jgi:antitoxin MazE
MPLFWKSNYKVITLIPMRIRIIDIGNSRGIRLPKALIEEMGFTDEVELQRTAKGLIITPVKEARAGWAELFKLASGPVKEDKGWSDAGNKFDKEEWTW